MDFNANALVARISDLADMSFKKQTVQYSSFLTPAEQALLLTKNELKKNVTVTFEGGYEGAERKMAVLSPLNYEEELLPPICVLSLDYRGERLSHRDILGALMGLGIKREKVGDILSAQQKIICHSSVAEYIRQNLIKVGRANVTVSESVIESAPQKEITIIKANVASLRLDAIVAEGFNIKRPLAVEAIKSGLVYVNWLECNSPSKEVRQGDKISLKGHGKIELAEIGGLSRKGRIFIEISKYK